MTLRARRVDNIGGFAEPSSDSWDDEDVTTHEVTMRPVPVASVDTSKYVRDTLSESEVGAVDALAVSAVHDGDAAALSLSWEDSSRDDAVLDADDFVDKASVAFPLEPGASVMSMGSENAPINAWYWRADSPEPYDVIARGLGTTERREPSESSLRCAAEYDGERWKVVFVRDLAVESDGYVDLPVTTGIAFAVWEGSNDERGPMKSYSGEFGSFGLGERRGRGRERVK